MNLKVRKEYEKVDGGLRTRDDPSVTVSLVIRRIWSFIVRVKVYLNKELVKG